MTVNTKEIPKSASCVLSVTRLFPLIVHTAMKSHIFISTLEVVSTRLATSHGGLNGTLGNLARLSTGR